MLNGDKKILAISDTYEQLVVVLNDSGVTEAGISCAMYFSLDADKRTNIRKAAKDNGKLLYLNMPLVFRKRATLKFDELWDGFRLSHFAGFIAQSYDEIVYLKDRGITTDRIILGERIYTFNNIAVNTFREMGYTRFIAPVELKASELGHRDNAGAYLKIYGYQVMMITANCLRKNVKECDKTESIMYLSDRKQNSFPVRNVCLFCYNIIYNHLPTVLIKRQSDIESLGMDFVVEFTVEDAKTVNNVLKALEGNINWDENIPYTAGHFNRGVE